MKTLYIILGALLLITACETDLDQAPPNIASADSLTEFDGVLNAAYYYQLGTATPMAVMGDFRADNAFMFEAPYDEFDKFGPDLSLMEDQFFGPFYTDCYKSILSSNIVIENSESGTDIAEAKFLRGLAYFKLVRAFGDATINTSASPSVTDNSILARQPASVVYSDVIIPDFQAARDALSANITNGRASKYAAQGMLGKAYLQMGDYGSAETELAAVVNGASGAGIELQADYSKIFGAANDLNSEIIYATQVSSLITDTYGFSDFWAWSSGNDSKSDFPLEQDLIDAFDAVAGDVLLDSLGNPGIDFRRAVTIDEVLLNSPKFPQENGPDHDWIELRLADVILMYAEALNENGKTGDAIVQLNKIRNRAGLKDVTASSQGDVRQAIADERRLELAFEGHRWFDLVRTGTVDAEMGETINSNYHLFPLPGSEITASRDVITQNPGY